MRLHRLDRARGESRVRVHPGLRRGLALTVTGGLPWSPTTPLNDSFIILDEAQKHLAQADSDVPDTGGLRSKVVVTATSRRSDLPKEIARGLVMCVTCCRHRRIRFIEFNHKDVVRHKLRQEESVEAYKDHTRRAAR